MIAPSLTGTGPPPIREFRAFVAVSVGLHLLWLGDVAVLSWQVLGSVPVRLVPHLVVVAVFALLLWATVVALLEGVLVLTLVFLVNAIFGVVVGSVTWAMPALIGMLLGLRAALSPPRTPEPVG